MKNQCLHKKLRSKNTNAPCKPTFRPSYPCCIGISSWTTTLPNNNYPCTET